MKLIGWRMTTRTCTNAWRSSTLTTDSLWPAHRSRTHWRSFGHCCTSSCQTGSYLVHLSFIGQTSRHTAELDSRSPVGRFPIFFSWEQSLIFCHWKSTLIKKEGDREELEDNFVEFVAILYPGPEVFFRRKETREERERTGERKPLVAGDSNLTIMLP